MPNIIPFLHLVKERIEPSDNVKRADDVQLLFASERLLSHTVLNSLGTEINQPEYTKRG